MDPLPAFYKVKSERPSSPRLLHHHHDLSKSPDAAPPLYRFGTGMAQPATQWPPYTLPPFAPPDEFDDDDHDDQDEHEQPGASSKKGKTVRRRSSKACDQCRKSKCKCERTAPGQPCRSCLMLGTECTFLGPSRKRGPPKGYIDAIEARLHQTEALVGILLAAAEGDNDVDERTRGVLRDLGEVCWRLLLLFCSCGIRCPIFCGSCPAFFGGRGAGCVRSS
ncbi:hypothetical protein B0H10DRAFT_879977 [Mycena sp. CBHHK59/15]|nr:hypothetical protein B0H10DRAFT_879977 [Mycena sp. CBHHK59/15]